MAQVLKNHGAKWELSPGQKLTPVLAVGSNAAPVQLARKFPKSMFPDGVVIPVLRCVLPDFDVVYAPLISSYGSCTGESTSNSSAHCVTCKACVFAQKRRQAHTRHHDWGIRFSFSSLNPGTAALLLLLTLLHTCLDSHQELFQPKQNFVDACLHRH